MVGTVETARSAPSAPAHQRTVFSTPRVLEFFSDKELAMQLGVGRHQWALALVKELLDNARDACETVPVAPVITLSLTRDTLAVADNGPGLPYEVLTRSLDYLQRISDKAYYISPTRGQLGNALKTAWAAPFVVSGAEGRIDVQTATYAVRVRIALDRIAQQPTVTVEPLAAGVVQNGTTLTLHWPGIASELSGAQSPGLYNGTAYDTFSHGVTYTPERLLAAYAAFNPHATFTLWHGEADRRFPATAPAWGKWAPVAAREGLFGSPHWYTTPQLG